VILKTIKIMKKDISKYNPCEQGREFYKQFDTFNEAWKACPRGDWMLWMAGRLGVDRRTITLASALCANTVRHLMKDERSTKAVDAAISFGRGEIDNKNLFAAAADAAAVEAVAYAAYAAADAADAAAAYAAAYAAADAAYAAAYAAAAAAADAAAADDVYAAAAVAAAVVAAAAAAAAAAVAAADAAAAATENKKETAEICREILTEKVFELINK
jgi:hypothetical protein